MCYVTATELKKNLSYYLKLSEKENVYVTKNKKVITVLTNPKAASFDLFFQLDGCLKDSDNGESYDDMIGEEIMKKCGF